jgi:predicted transcriptional regulator
MAAQSSDQFANTLFDLITGHRVTAVIYVAAQLGICDLLAEGRKNATELARLTGTHERSLLRLMRTLVALGLCKEAEAGEFELTEMGTHLAARSERSLKAWALVEGDMLRAAWAQLVESVRSGKTENELAGRGQEQFEIMAKSARAELFNEGMASMTRVAVSAVLADYDFSGISTLMDVGGGVGELMSAILKKYPSMRGIVFDLPHCAEGRKNLTALGCRRPMRIHRRKLL